MIPCSVRYGAGFLSMLLWPRNEKAVSPSVAAGAGALAALAYWTSQEVGVAALAAGLFVFRGAPGARRPLLFWAAGAGVVLGVGFAAVALASGGGYFRAAVMGVGNIQLKIRRALPPLFEPLLWREGGWRRVAAWVGLAESLAARLPALTYAGAGGALLLSGRFRRAFPGPVVAGLVIYGALTASSAWSRSDRWHIYFALAPALVLWAVLADGVRGGGGAKASLAAILAGGLLTAPVLWASADRDRASNAALVGLTLPRMGRVRLPYGQARAYAGLVEWVEDHTSPGEPIFAYPSIGALYFLANRPNPCWFCSPLDAVRPEEQRAMTAELETRRVRWVIWDTQYTHFDGVPIETFLPVTNDYLKSHYRPKEKWGPFIFMERSS
jgi:hypothetical protein